ncbi:Delta endotoxin central region subgroup 1 [Fusarium subglutinans]|uniref:Delta endotoxin central region subgroup 1 n=1 Tax=Gibberella subglutinans TaxID=42677 RepID=A0A8H5L8Y0_GIBSU|nr:Delta endotoxin central region subgroup 1 [Fusarium subglutinans]KAF5585995.1 Delta endotoxin central region subgroup 1 [Fusarium subglutinans]
MVKIDDAFLNKAVKKGLDTIRNGEHLDLEDPNEIGNFIFGILASGLELIPGYGDALAAVLNLFSPLIFQPKSAADIWEKLLKRIEHMIDSKIEEYHLETLKDKLAGLDAAINDFSALVKEHDEGRDVTTLLLGYFTSLHQTMIVSMSEFTSPKYGVASLPWFALAATMPLKLLGDGIQHGRKWGFSADEVDFLQETFDKLTTENATISHAEIASRHKLFLENLMLDDTRMSDVPTETLEKWRSVHEYLATMNEHAIPAIDNSSYVTYAKTTYDSGRYNVKAEWEGLSGYDTGAKEGALFRAKMQYDAGMTIHVLNYADLWPYLAGKELTEEALTNLDGEIFASRGRHDIRVNAVYVGGITNVELLQIKYGDKWGTAYGSDAIDKASTTDLDIKAGEYLYWLDVWFGQKLGCAQFWLNNGNMLREVGRSGSTKGELWFADHQVTSVYGINYESHPPSGLEGIIVGFRPLFLKWD